MKETIEIKVYYYIDENGKKVIDEDYMKEELEDKLQKLRGDK